MLFNIVSVAALAAIAHAAPAMESSTLATKVTSTTASTSSHATSHTNASSASHHASATQSASNLAASQAAAIAKQMHSEITAVDRFNDLLSDGKGGILKDQEAIQQRVVFDFNAAVPNKNATGGRILVANEKNYPILTDLGIAGAVAFLNPCSMNTPHTHPRATELLTLVKGKLQTGMMLENGFNADPKLGPLTTQISAELSPFQATVFPQGSIHFQFNPTCEEAIFVAALSSSDPGTSQVAQNFFFEDERIVNITLGQPKELNGANIETFRSKIPANLVQAMDTCITSCKAKGYKF